MGSGSGSGSGYPNPNPDPNPNPNLSALTKGETFRILYNKKKYDIGVVEVRPEGRPFQQGEAQAVCIIEADVEVRRPPCTRL